MNDKRRPAAAKAVGSRRRVKLGPYKAITEPPEAYRLPPPGEYVAKIIRASRSAMPWRATPANPSGDCVSMLVSVGQDFGLVLVDVPSGTWLVKAVAASVGIGRAMFSEPDCLQGKQARVVIAHHTAKDGTTKAVIAKWLPAAVSAPPAKWVTAADAINAWLRSGDEPGPESGANTEGH